MNSQFSNWLFIGIAGIAGVACVYFVSWHIFAYIAPKKVEKFELNFVVRDIKHYFGFLFEKGYKICSAYYAYQHFGNWGIQLESQDCVIFIVQDRFEISISFSPVFESRDYNHQIGLQTMIYFLSKGKNFVGSFNGNHFWNKKRQFERMAVLLNEYLDQIVPYFGKNLYYESKVEFVDAYMDYVRILGQNAKRA
ncbi:MAG: hypothetical protein IH589_06650 [Anaerolineales bacterium]|nr:hypothetical protein [Anaerolineales bacterium]